MMSLFVRTVEEMDLYCLMKDDKMKIISTSIEIKDDDCLTVIPIDSGFEKEKEKYKDKSNTLVIMF